MLINLGDVLFRCVQKAELKLIKVEEKWCSGAAEGKYVTT